jgi:glycosyltransferase involved in cell wall biosynthesis
MNMKFSIIINVLNGEKYIEETINSIIKQTYTNWELIIFDNASTDRTLEKVYKIKDPRIQIIKNILTVPLGAGRNLAIEYTSGDLLSFLDADDIYSSDRLQEYYDYFLVNADVDIVYSNSYVIDAASEVKRILYKKPMKSGYLTRSLIKNYFLSLETVCFRRKILGNFKFNPQFSFIEEADFFIRLSENRKFGYIDQPLACWREHIDSMTFYAPEKFYEEAIEFQRILKCENVKFYKKFSFEITNFINNQRVFNYKTKFLLGSGKRNDWIKALWCRRKAKDFIQILVIRVLPVFLLKKVYL